VWRIADSGKISAIRHTQVAAIAALAAGCAVEGPAYEKANLPPEKAAVYVYRLYPTMGVGAGLVLPISCGDNSTLLGPGGYHVFNVEPGEVLVSSHMENSASVQIAAEAGHEYYVRGYTSMGFLMPRVNLETVDAGTAEAELRECKRQWPSPRYDPNLSPQDRGNATAYRSVRLAQS